MPAPIVTLTAAELHALRTSRIAIPVRDAVFRVEGPGTFSCLQGLVTNDVSKLADRTAAWGAFLSPKGMIVSDAWVVRDGDAAWVIVPYEAHETMSQLFGRTMPPRLAKVADQSITMAVHWLAGGVIGGIDDAAIIRPERQAPFAAMLLTPNAAATDALLIEQGWSIAPASHADALKVVFGWPTLRREIDDKTLPQEVRFDELGGVKYDKGCYTGQETVARLHFRGHANRALRAVQWPASESSASGSVTVGEKIIGTLNTVVQFGDQCIALAKLRREATPGESVRVGDADGVIVELPLDLGALSVA